MLRTILILCGVLFAGPAFAHLGHVGEVAGHSHWIGLGAVVVAGIFAAAIGKYTQKDKDEELEEDAEPDEETPVEG